MHDTAQQEMFAAAADGGPPESEAFLLTTLEVYNWGPFQGKHRAAIDPGGSAIVGPTGSGKTTLIDALMTLLARSPKYNLASTGGHESDRDLISYVRGVTGGTDTTGESAHVARPGKTLTAIAATYRAGEAVVRLGVLLWTSGPSNAANDLKRRWFFTTREDATLELLLRLYDEGGTKALVRHEKETSGLQIFGSKTQYLARARSFFEVGENAFSLLNRAAGLKQLNSIDQIFRELVLDDRSAFKRALEVAAEFDVLAGIHAELATARNQRDALLPVEAVSRKLDATNQKLDAARELRRILPIWFATLGGELWSLKIEQIDRQKSTVASELAKLRTAENASKEKLATLDDIYRKLGGSQIEQLRETIGIHQKQLQETRAHAETYQRFAKSLGLPGDLVAPVFEENLRLLAPLEKETTDARAKQHDELLESLSKQRDAAHEEEELNKELRAVKERPGSNLPANYQRFREGLAGELGLRVDELPFIAELIEVLQEETAWHGAIERALGSEHLRILVPPAAMHDALDLVNRTHSGLHVRLLDARPPRQAPEFFPDSFVHKIRVKPHLLQDALYGVFDRQDRHCVDSPDALRITEHAMTREGMMSGRHGNFDKQDQRRLDEGWMTGFDNAHQLRALAARILKIQSLRKELAETCKTQKQAEAELQQQLAMIEGIRRLEFEKIDLPAAQQKEADFRARLEALIAPDSDTSKAHENYEIAEKEHAGIRAEIELVVKRQGGLETDMAAAEKRRDEALARCGDGLTDEERATAQQEIPVSEETSADDLGKLEREANSLIQDNFDKLETQKANREQELVRAMNGAKFVDTGALNETGTELPDIPDYLERLRVLQEEALPEKSGRFIEYLNRSSGQSITQLLASITNEVREIEERIADLNATLSRVEFRDGHFLQLEPQRVTHELLRTLDRANKRLTTAIADPGEESSENHYKALQAVVQIIREAAEKRHTVGAQALLDPRHRLQFFVVEIDRATGTSSGRRTGSQTGSGGEKEMMASYILTASLSYALCPRGATRPRYATIVLDEAFSKSSQAAASRIIEALRAFGLHPLFVTPNKEMGLLKAHTRSAILVHNKTQSATLTSLSWEEIENYRTRNQ